MFSLEIDGDEMSFVPIYFHSEKSEPGAIGEEAECVHSWSVCCRRKRYLLHLLERFRS
jgi:hypothetical protein